ncbi:methyl-accepting chemotaxis protein [Pelagicoccus albus]|uniref:Methyl-accepting transducer domain-containing protein n=1 Tax=Pelagicoccus albus TaxID=415222 RepID=A0A7X1E7V6_9BACT|nr:methyl-accepting chemotaxis protein [Pelagicoccus albus]MBC2605586.1 hypothetical protein [Pelagicoccus albus]
MSKLTLQQRLMGGFLAVAAIGLVIGLVGLSGLRESRLAISEIRDQVFERGKFLVSATDLARSSQVNFKIQVQEWKNTLIRGHDKEQFNKYWGKFQEREAIVQKNFRDLEALLNKYEVPSEDIVEAAEEHLKLGHAYREAIKSFDAGDLRAHQTVDKLVKGIDREPTRKIDDIVSRVKAFEADAAASRSEEFEASSKAISLATTIVMILGVSIAVALGLWIGGSLTKKIKQITTSLQVGSEVVDNASSEVSRYGQALADSTNREAASMQQASASLEVLASNTRRNAETANAASDIANQTRSAVNSGKGQMDEMQAAMLAIQTSSDGISQILKSIDEIAFQTNILALNAAVEAARAGEAGAGFAVVADEVRNLAQRSAKAAQETSERIEDSITKSRHGVELSTRVTVSLEDILQKAAELDDLVASIAESVAQNKDGVDQVNTAIRSMENSYQSNAALTEESAASAAELSEQALSLNRSVGELAGLCGLPVSSHQEGVGRNLHTLPQAERGRRLESSFEANRKESSLWN